jgi:hypothetical protein
MSTPITASSLLAADAWYGLGRAGPSPSSSPLDVLVAVALEANGETRAAKRRQQVEPETDELASGRQVNQAVGREPSRQRIDRRRSDIVERAEHRDTPQRFTTERVGVVGAVSVRAQPLDGARPAAHHCDGIRRRRLVTEEGP